MALIGEYLLDYVVIDKGIDIHQLAYLLPILITQRSQTLIYIITYIRQMHVWVVRGIFKVGIFHTEYTATVTGRLKALRTYRVSMVSSDLKKERHLRGILVDILIEVNSSLTDVYIVAQHKEAVVLIVNVNVDIFVSGGISHSVERLGHIVGYHISDKGFIRVVGYEVPISRLVVCAGHFNLLVKLNLKALLRVSRPRALSSASYLSDKIFKAKLFIGIAKRYRAGIKLFICSNTNVVLGDYFDGR